MPQEQLIETVAQYARTHPGRALEYHALNEAAIVLLSAYLEGFIEKLHAEAMEQLLGARTKSKGVLEKLIGYAHRRYSNPTPNRIRGLFNICGMSDIISRLKRTDERDIEKFVKLRNKIAHGVKIPKEGRDVEDWVNLIRVFADDLNSLVEQEINVMR